jgi:hypothetical protein
MLQFSRDDSSSNLYVHVAMKTSRKLRIQKLEVSYRLEFNEFLNRVEDGKSTEMPKTLRMLALKEIWDDVTVISDWPVNYLTVLEVIASIILPVLSYIVKYLSLG